MRYRFHMVCPLCGNISEIVHDRKVPEPHVSCGECLFNHVEVVNLKVVKVEREKGDNNAA